MSKKDSVESGLRKRVQGYTWFTENKNIQKCCFPNNKHSFSIKKNLLQEKSGAFTRYNKQKSIGKPNEKLKK